MSMWQSMILLWFDSNRKMSVTKFHWYSELLMRFDVYFNWYFAVVFSLPFYLTTASGISTENSATMGTWVVWLFLWKRSVRLASFSAIPLRSMTWMHDRHLLHPHLANSDLYDSPLSDCHHQHREYLVSECDGQGHGHGANVFQWEWHCLHRTNPVWRKYCFIWLADENVF